MHYRSCSICNNVKFDLFLPPVYTQENNPFEHCNSYISICRNCGLIFVNPQPDFKTMSVFTKRIHDDFQVYGEGQILEPLFNERLNIIKRLLGSKTPKRILDISVRTGGWLLKLLKDVFKDCEVYGVDPDIHAVRFGRERYKLDNLYCCTFEDCEFPENFFDLIISTASLCRHYSPEYALQKMEKILKPDGNLFLELTMLTCDNAYNEWPGYLLDLEDWFYLNVPVYYWYHEDHLPSLLMSHDFRIVEKGQHIFNPHGYTQAFWWFWLKKEQNITTTKNSSFSGLYSKVTDYFFDYCEKITVSDLKELLTVSPESIGLLGPKEENFYIARLIQKIVPETNIWFAELDLEILKRESVEDIDFMSIQGLISDRKPFDMILLTAVVDEEEFAYISKMLKDVSSKIYQGFYQRPGKQYKTHKALYFNHTLQEKRLLKSFVPNLISKKGKKVI